MKVRVTYHNVRKDRLIDIYCKVKYPSFLLPSVPFLAANANLEEIEFRWSPYMSLREVIEPATMVYHMIRSNVKGMRNVSTSSEEDCRVVEITMPDGSVRGLKIAISVPGRKEAEEYRALGDQYKAQLRRARKDLSNVMADPTSDPERLNGTVMAKCVAEECIEKSLGVVNRVKTIGARFFD